MKKGDVVLWLSSWPSGELDVVEILGENPNGGIYFRKLSGGTDTTTEKFLYVIPKGLRTEPAMDVETLTYIEYPDEKEDIAHREWLEKEVYEARTNESHYRAERKLEKHVAKMRAKIGG